MKDGKLRHAGQVGTGFDHKMMKAIYDRLEPLITKTLRLTPKPKIKDVTWVKSGNGVPGSFSRVDERGHPARAGVCRFARRQGARRSQPRRADDQSSRLSERNGAAAEPTTPQLDLSGKEVTVEIDGHRLKFTNLDKVYFPKDGWKKRDLLVVL